MMDPDQILLIKKDVEIPAPIENRVPTNVKFLLALKVIPLVLLPFVIYTLCYSDIDRYRGYDNCGNICGVKNAKYDQWDCTGKDFTDKKFLKFRGFVNTPQYHLISRECVSNCSQYDSSIPCNEVADIARLVYFIGLGDFLQSVAGRLTFACFLSLGVALAMLWLFRVAPAFMVWCTLSAAIIFLIIIGCYLWKLFFQELITGGFVIIPIFVTILVSILIGGLVVFYKKIFFIIVIFKEAMKVTFDIPQLLLVPFLTLLMNFLVVSLFVTVLVYMLSAGVLSEIAEGFLDYESNIVMNLTTILTFSTLCWVSQFILGIQYMVVAGAVSKWYFAKNKNNLGDSTETSATIVYKFHLGSIAFGSLIITIIATVRLLVSSMLKNSFLKRCFTCWISLHENFLNYMSKNSYIMTAMHGKPFFESGKRPAQILYQNLRKTVLISFIGGFVIFMAHMLVMFISLLFTYFIMKGAVYFIHVWSVYVIVAFVSLIVSSIFLSIFESIIDTFYLCFCEDKLMNDGFARPYAMSTDLMKHFTDFLDQPTGIDVYNSI